MGKTKRHVLTFEQEYDFQMIGICSHHNDYRLAWSINEALSISLVKSQEDFVVVNKKGLRISEHSLYEFRDELNMTEYYLIKNKRLTKYLIPEKPAVDYFLFLVQNQLFNLEELLIKIKTTPIVQTGFIFDPEEFESTELIVFN